MLSQRGAISLSINLLVVVILSLIILVSGVTLLYKFIGGASDIKAQIDERTEQELQRLMVDEGKQVALPLHVAAVHPGENHVFGLGIKNIGDTGDEFQIEVQFTKLIDDEEQDITTTVNPEDAEAWLLYNQDPIRILEGDHHLEPILISVPDAAHEGQYIFKVRVLLANGQQYGTTQNFYVTVK